MATIVFDLNGTLLDPAHLALPLGGPAHAGLVERGFDHAIGQAMALTLAGEHRPLRELVEAGLRVELELDGREPDLAAKAVELLGTMPAFAEVPAALEHVRAAGHRVVVLTNSDRESGIVALANAGILELVHAVHGTEEVRAFKPDPRVYALVPDADWLVAAHWWDVHGARAAGIKGCWVARKERVLPRTTTADATGADVLAAVRAITA